MKFSHVVSTCFTVACVAAAPKAYPVPESQFDLGFLNDVLEGREDSFMIEELSESLHKRDQQSVESILESVNSSGIIFELLDSIANDPQQIEGLANYTGALLKNINISSLIYGAGSSSTNYSKILSIVSQSGLVTSLVDGTLLDPSFQPVLAKITERVILANEDLLLVLYSTLLRPASNQKRADNEGSASTLFSNLLSSVLGSGLLENTVSDILGALNDTGIALYVTKRFLSTPLYLNMTGALVSDIMNSGAIDISGLAGAASSFNLTKIIDGALADPKLIVNTVTGILSGNYDSSALGEYGAALSNITHIMENDGLFVQLNSLLFPSTSTTNGAQSTNSAKKAEAAGNTTSSSASSSSKAGASSMTVPGCILGAIFSALLML
ncbi:hypothetical protein CAAN1_27S00386 [[Candida] anglica]|uniref:Uncharacterized protein n=1 Tax=[Candida] anglica TaxID=148631 RepID=A0ABP0EAC1_9ASCO